MSNVHPETMRKTQAANALRPLDAFTAQHLHAWIGANVSEHEQPATEQAILSFVSAHPDLIEKGRTWSEIRMLAQRVLA